MSLKKRRHKVFGIKLYRWSTPLFILMRSVLVEAALHLSAELVLPIAAQRFWEQHLSYSIEHLLQEIRVHVSLVKIHR